MNMYVSSKWKICFPTSKQICVSWQNDLERQKVAYQDTEKHASSDFYYLPLQMKIVWIDYIFIYFLAERILFFVTQYWFWLVGFEWKRVSTVYLIFFKQMKLVVQLSVSRVRHFMK